MSRVRHDAVKVVMDDYFRTSIMGAKPARPGARRGGCAVMRLKRPLPFLGEAAFSFVFVILQLLSKNAGLPRAKFRLERCGKECGRWRLTGEH